VLPLADTPPANELVTKDERGKAQDRFPLRVFLCRDCGHAQLLDIVSPERLFRNYVYVSSTSPVFVEHFRRYAESLLAMIKPPAGATVIDIGSNDGALLRFFQQAGWRVLGIDPARAIAERATQAGIPTRAEFFTPALAERLAAEGWRASLITANNVFAHADDLHGIVEGVRRLLTPDGLFVFEVSYLVDVVDKLLFDTIYHEHLSYHTVKPLVGFFARHGMELIDAVRVDSHGGSLRGIAKLAGGPSPRQPRVDERIDDETRRGLFAPEAYRALGERIARRGAELVELLRSLRTQGKRVVGFGVPAKATTLMYAFGIGPELIDYLIDDSPWKQGLFSPGHHIPILPSSAMADPRRRPDYLLILAWNFAPSIMAKQQAFHDAGGRFIVPLPDLEVR